METPITPYPNSGNFHPSKPRGSGRRGKPTWNQAAKIVAKFGSEAKLAESCGINRSTVYKWFYPRPYGCDGLVPPRSVAMVNSAARSEGIFLTGADWTPERVRYEYEPTQEEDIFQ